MLTGRKDEVIGDGREAKHGCAYGWHCVRLSKHTLLGLLLVFVHDIEFVLATCSMPFEHHDCR